MAVSKALQRLLRIRELEEEQRKLALEAELSRLHRLDAALEGSNARRLRGRALLRTGDAEDRLAALVELEAAEREASVLQRHRIEAERESERLRSLFLEKRTERRQAEGLIETARSREETEDRLRAQQRLDDWHASRRSIAGANLPRQKSEKDEGIASELSTTHPQSGKTFRL